MSSSRYPALWPLVGLPVKRARIRPRPPAVPPPPPPSRSRARNWRRQLLRDEETVQHLVEIIRCRVLPRLVRERCRLLRDYRGDRCKRRFEGPLNHLTWKNWYPLPLINKVLDWLVGVKVYTKIDIRYQVMLFRLVNTVTRNLTWKVLSQVMGADVQDPWPGPVTSQAG